MMDQRYQSLLESAWDIIMSLSRDGLISSANRGFEFITGWPRAEWAGRSLFELLHPDDLDLATRRLREAAEGQVHPPFELRLRSRTGALIPAEAVVTQCPDGATFDRLICVARDVSEKKWAAAMFREREQRFQELVEGTRAVPFEADCLERRFTYVGPQVEKLLGYSPQDCCEGNFWFEHVHPAHWSRLDDFPASPRATSADQEFIYSMVAADGREVWLLHIARRAPGGRVARGFLVDVTAQQQARLALEQSREQHRALAARIQTAREEERLHIAREIHDELGQSLTYMRMETLAVKLELQKLDGEMAGRSIARMEALESMVAETMRNVRRIATDLRPPILDRIGLFAAIEWQANEFEQRYKIRCKVDRDLEEPTLEPDRAIAVFRILQELLTNVARHAHASQVAVRVRQERDGLTLSVTDNGRGMAAEDEQRPGHFGIIGMKERAQAFGGTLEISSNRRGTRAVLSIPVHAGALSAFASAT